MGEHPAWQEFERIRAAEERRIKKIANPAERARKLAHFDKWAEEESQNIRMLIGIRENTYM